MAHMDLTPIRAGIADMLETSHFNGVQDRIEGKRSAKQVSSADVAPKSALYAG